jgi:hypothetical protein
MKKSRKSTNFVVKNPQNSQILVKKSGKSININEKSCKFTKFSKKFWEIHQYYRKNQENSPILLKNPGNPPNLLEKSRKSTNFIGKIREILYQPTVQAAKMAV